MFRAHACEITDCARRICIYGLVASLFCLVPTAFGYPAEAGNAASSPKVVMTQARAALEDRRRLGDRPGVLEAQIVLASALIQLGGTAEARSCLMEVLAQNDGRDDLAVRALLQLAQIDGGDNPAAGLVHLDRAYPLALRSGRHDLLIRVQRERSECLIRMSRLREALATLSEALQVAKREDLGREEIALRGTRASAYGALGSGTQALNEIELGLKLAQELRLQPEQAALLARHALIDLDLARDKTAHGHAEEAVTIALGYGNPDLLAECQRVQAFACFSFREQEKGLELISQVRQHVRGRGGLPAETELLLDALYACSGNLEYMTRVARDLEPLALDPSTAPLAKAEFLAMHAVIAESLSDFARAERDLGEAVALAAKANGLDQLCRLRGRLASFLRAHGRFAEAEEMLGVAIAEIQRTSWRSDEWWLWCELAAVQAATDRLTLARRSSTRALAEHRQSKTRPRNGRVERILTTDTRAGLATILDIRARGGDDQGAFETAELAHSLRMHELAAMTGGRAPTEVPIGRGIADGVRSALRAGDLFIEYVFADPTSYVFIIDRSGLRLQRLSPATHIADKALVVEYSLKERLPLPELRPALAHVSNYILFPVLATTTKPPRRIIVVTDGMVEGLPFELLPVDKIDDSPGEFSSDGRLLVEYSRVSYALSAATWLAGGGAASGMIDTEVPIAALLPGGPAGAGLEGARSEIERALTRFGGVDSDRRVRVQNRSFGQAIQVLPRSGSLLHFGVRAELNTDAPDLTGIVYDNQTGGTEIVHLSQLAAYNRTARLAVVSSMRRTGSCPAEAALGRAVLQTLIGMGCSGVLMPSWDVPDASTAAFLRDLHDSLAKGIPAEDAVREAKVRSMRRDAAAPPDWAAYRLVGRGDWPLFRRTLPWWTLLIAGCLLAAAGAAVRRFSRRG